MNFDLIIGDRPDRRFRGPNSGPFDATRVLEFGNPDLVLLDHGNDVPGIEVMEQQSDWVCLYRDGMAQLWGRAATYDDPASPLYLPPARRRIGDEEQTGVAAWPAFPNRSGRLAFIVRPGTGDQVVRSTPTR